MPFPGGVVCGAVGLGPAEAVDMAHVGIDALGHSGAGLLDFGSKFCIGKLAQCRQVSGIGFEGEAIDGGAEIDFPVLAIQINYPVEAEFRLGARTERRRRGRVSREFEHAAVFRIGVIDMEIPYRTGEFVKVALVASVDLG